MSQSLQHRADLVRKGLTKNGLVLLIFKSSKPGAAQSVSGTIGQSKALHTSSRTMRCQIAFKPTDAWASLQAFRLSKA